MLAQNQIISLEIDGLGSSGEGVGSYQGLRIFVDGALPGETVKAKINLIKKTYAKGLVVEIISPSADRTIPPCPFYERCGGCQVMHLNYSAQLEMKRQRVQDALKRIGGFNDMKVNACIPSPKEFGYRNKIQLFNGQQQIGFYERGTHNIVDVDRCLIHCELGEEIFQQIRKRKLPNDLKYILIRSSIKNQEALVIFVTKESTQLISIADELMKDCKAIKGVIQNINPKDNNVILGKSYVTLCGKSFIHDTICDMKFKVSPASFFQVNPLQAENMYQQVLEFTDSKASDKIIDAYCGVGTLSLILAKNAKEVIGIESVSQAIEDAKDNAKLNGVKNCRFICKETEKALKEFINADTVVLNPPRKGCTPEVMQALNKTRPKKIVYLSCDPATLARDLKLLNGYSIESVQPFDMFPQTAHVETLVKLSSS